MVIKVDTRGKISYGVIYSNLVTLSGRDCIVAGLHVLYQGVW